MCFDWGPVAKHLLQLSPEERWQGRGPEGSEFRGQTLRLSVPFEWEECVGGVLWCGRCEGHKVGRREFRSNVRVSEAREVQPKRGPGMFALPLTHSAFIFRALQFGGVWKHQSAEMAPYAVTKNDCFSATKWIPGLPSHHFSKSLCMFRKVGSSIWPSIFFCIPTPRTSR